MQISLPVDKARSLQTQYYNCLSNQGERDYRLATLFYKTQQLVTSEGFDAFARSQFKLNDSQLSKAREMVTVRSQITRRRVWLRLGGYRLVKLVSDISDETRRTEILDRILAPSGIVNYSESDLQMLIKGENLSVSEVILTESYTRTRTKGRKTPSKGRNNQKVLNRRRKASLV